MCRGEETRSLGTDWASSSPVTFTLAGGNKMKTSLMKFIASSIAVVLLAGSLASAGDSPDQKRDKTRKMAAQTMNDLYKLEPTAQEAIQNAAGYAVFNNMGTNI